MRRTSRPSGSPVAARSAISCSSSSLEGHAPARADVHGVSGQGGPREPSYSPPGMARCYPASRCSVDAVPSGHEAMGWAVGTRSCAAPRARSVLGAPAQARAAA